MKLVRYGEPGEEKPGLVDDDGAIRDLGEDLTRLHDALRRLPDAIDDWADVGAQLKAGKLSLGGGPKLRPWFLRLAWLAGAAALGAAAMLAFS